jgi:hypothetical protein
MILTQVAVDGNNDHLLAFLATQTAGKHGIGLINSCVLVIDYLWVMAYSMVVITPIFHITACLVAIPALSL